MIGWVAGLDAAASAATLTINRLGGLLLGLLLVHDAGIGTQIAAFLLFHFTLWAALGVAVTGVVHRAERAPWILLATALTLILLLLGIASATEVLDALLLGPGAWLRIPGGTVLGLALLWVLVGRRHPLLDELRRAGEDQDL